MKVSGSTIAKCVTREYRGLLMNLFISFFFIGLTTVAAISQGSSPVWNIVKPSTTGVPGEEVRVMTFDPAGLFVVARPVADDPALPVWTWNDRVPFATFAAAADLDARRGTVVAGTEAQTIAAGPLMVIEVETSPSGIPSKRTSMSASDETDTPQRPTSPSARGSSASLPMSVGMSNAVERPVCPPRRRYLKRSFVSRGVPKPANWRMVQTLPRYMVG